MSNALTKKRKSAIYKYVKLKTIDHPTIDACIGYTLKADRMAAEKLYQHLKSRGFIWDARRQYWREKRR